MLHRIVHIVFLVLLLQSCTQPVPEGKQRVTSFDETIEAPKNTSLFLNQKEKLFQFTPKNERSKDRKVDALLKTVEKAIQKKDLKLLFSVMDKEIVFSWGGGEIGEEGFMRTWENDFSKFWEKIDWIVKMGGFYESDTTFRLPYCDEFDRFPQTPDAIGEPYGYGMCVSATTQFYPNPYCKETEATDIGYAFALIDLEFGFNGEKEGVFKINPIDTGIHGYVKAAEFYRSSDYCLIIEKNKQGTWKIAAFAPWD